MKRRTFLSSVGAGVILALSGCTGTNPETEGNDDNPIDADPEELRPPSELFDDGWERDLESSDGNTAEGSFSNDDEQETIPYRVTIYDTVTEAQSAYQDQRDQDFAAGEAEAGWSAEGLQIASNSHISETSLPIVWFRDANVVAELYHATYSGGGSASKSKQYAADWHETWRE